MPETVILGGGRRKQSRPKQVVVIHTNEGPETATGAESLAQWLASKSFGYHETVDSNSYVRTAWDDETTNGARGGNEFSYHICGIGYAAQTTAQWNDAYSSAELDILDDRTAAACQRLGIEPRRISVPELMEVMKGGRGPTGICGHGDITLAAKALGDSKATHTDPGAGFPWTVFIATVEAVLDPENDMNLVKLVPDKPLSLAQGGAAYKGKRPAVAAIGGTPLAFHVTAEDISKYGGIEAFKPVAAEFFKTLDIRSDG